MAVQKWRHYLLGRRRFIMRMNHRSLIKMDPNWFLERSLYKLIGFDFTIQYKLAPQSYGPFQILQRIGKVANKLNFPGKSHIHSLFHASLLKGKLGANVLAQSQLPVVLNSQAVLDQRQQLDKTEISVNWHGLSPADATKEDLQKLETLIFRSCP